MNWVILVAMALIQSAPMMGGGEISTRLDGDTLRIVVTGPRRGLAHLCVAEDSRIRILHASAALGEAVYEPDGDGWRLASGFDFKLRDRRDAQPDELERQSYFKTMGWLANADNSGNAPREFAVRVTAATQFVAAAFMAIDEPMTISRWPGAVADDCIATKVVQGYLPPKARFTPATWHPVSLRP